ncbi:adenylate kinase [Sphaerisporangium krabiense]|uniref:(d)CMP kinase n=1 Tax=Sphaerisporangium krabiense TaxID=763782 RepID=A0A7W8Z5C2_9ACTN|nr:(d)CMP kinase [Sphaerisporangium krabiense]MBB5627403.1 hypothetical protein [Sphaerisporangium krabiense]GII64460.1 adenylate kinase [Sphaerisporangium krabiense]
MPDDLSADAARVLAVRLRAERARVVAIEGPSGSGKTTLGRALAAELDAGLVHMEDFYPGWEGLRAGAERLVEWVLRPLAAGESPRWRCYDWTLGSYAGWRALPPSEVVVVEGAGAGSLAAGPYLSALIWLDAPPPVRRRRALGRPEDGEAYRPHWERWARQEAEYFTADRVPERADVTLDTG